jgi:hypothetical protein
MDNEQPYRIESPTRITLSPMAKSWAREFGMTNVQMAKHLLAQHKLQEAGLMQRNGES